MMNDAKVTGLRSIELSVRDLDRSVRFYTELWGLEAVVEEDDAVYLRGTGPEHHVVTLRPGRKAAVLSVHFAAVNQEAVDALHATALAQGVRVESAPGPLPRHAGEGYGCSLRSPDGQVLGIACNVARHPNRLRDRSRPKRLTHVVLNSAQLEVQSSFFMGFLGFRLSDSTATMQFLRSDPDHHSLALAHGSGPSLNHMAFEMEDIDGLMRGTGRLSMNEVRVEWGVGRHGPGNNVFAYFIDPNGFAVEYTTEVDQVDEAEHVPGTAEYWANFPMRPCRWGLAHSPSERMKMAMAGRLVAENASDS